MNKSIYLIFYEILTEIASHLRVHFGRPHGLQSPGWGAISLIPCPRSQRDDWIFAPLQEVTIFDDYIRPKYPHANHNDVFDYISFFGFCFWLGMKYLFEGLRFNTLIVCAAELFFFLDRVYIPLTLRHFNMPIKLCVKWAPFWQYYIFGHWWASLYINSQNLPDLTP